jgi:hypothetical protein
MGLARAGTARRVRAVVVKTLKSMLGKKGRYKGLEEGGVG